MKHKLSHRLTAAFCALMLLLALTPAAGAAETPAASSNINKQDYITYGSTVSSYLYANASGGLTRVEYTGGAVVVENYDSAYNLVDSRKITPELPIWGGFFAGSDANYLIFGQNNTAQSASAEVIRVVKYSKEWQKLGSASIKGAYTMTPFDAGSLRCAEYGGYLYIHAARKMFRNVMTMYGMLDTLTNHQANLTLEIRESDMTLVDSYDQIFNLDFGYVSHSFNQFILIDQDKNIVTLDHSDSNSDANGRANYGYAKSVASRGVDLIRYDEKAGQDHFQGKSTSQKYQWTTFSLVQGFAGSSGNNVTGASLGGFAETTNGYVSAYNYDGKGSTGARDVYLGYTAKSGLKSTAKKISTVSGTTTPQLASTGLGGGYILWNGKSGSSINNTLYYVSYSDGGTVSGVKTANAPLSDCQPISYNGKIVWYVTNNSAPTFYGLDASGVTVLGGAATSSTTTPSTTTPSTTTPSTTTPSTTTPSTTTPSTTTPSTTTPSTTTPSTTTPSTTTPSTTTPSTTTPSTTTPSTTTPSTTTPSTTTTSPVEASFEAHNIDPNSPHYGDILGGTADCNHNFSTSWRWYWPGTAGTTTCTENAYSYSTCTICGAKLVNGFMFAPGHQYKDGVCTVCGESENGQTPAASETSDTPTQTTTPAATTTPDTAAPTTTAPADTTTTAPANTTTTAPADTTTTPAPAAAPSTELPFTDVPANAYYTDAVSWALESGITTGTTATTFDPYTTCTRGQVVTFLWRAKGCPEPETTVNPFRDVSSTSPYYKAILWAYENNITTGTSTNTFSPNGTCTNGHVVTFLWRAEGEPAGSGGTLTNSFPVSYYTDAMSWAESVGLLADTGMAFNPASQSPRANIVTYLYRDLVD